MAEERVLDWRAEDTRYAAAVAMAVGVVLYLLAGNFGLVPSPLGGNSETVLRQVGPPSLTRGTVGVPGNDTAAQDAAARALAGLVVRPAPPERTPVAPPPPPPQPPSEPSSSFFTQNGALLLPGDTVSGESRSDLGIAFVDVSFVIADGTTTTSRTSLECTDGRRLCVWEVAPPGPGSYTVRAQATDRAGTQETPGTEITVTAVTAPPPVEDIPGVVDSLTSTVATTTGSAVQTTASLVRLVSPVVGAVVGLLGN